MKEVNRADFPLLVNNPDIVYLDSAATSLKPKSVIDKITEYYTMYGANIHRGLYELSNKATNEYELSREVVANFLNVSSNEVIYTKGTTNSLNMVSCMLSCILNPGDEIIVSSLDHHSSIIPLQELCKRKKAVLKFIELDEYNKITVENFLKVLSDKTKIVSITHVSNVLGVIAPVKEITKLAHEKNAIVICDGAQAVPHMKVDIKDLDVDFYAFSLHKMLGPTGCGILYGKSKWLKMFEPVEFGGDMNDFVYKEYSEYKDAPEKFEAGTPHIDGIIGIKEAIYYLNQFNMDEVYKHSHDLALYVYNELKKNEYIEVYNKVVENGVITFNIKGIHAHDTTTYLANKNICCRAGHHCAQLITKHLGVNGTVRASFYIYNTIEDAKALVSAVNEACEYFKEWMI